MTGFAYPDVLVQVYERFAAGDAGGAEDLYDRSCRSSATSSSRGTASPCARRSCADAAPSRATRPAAGARPHCADRTELDHLLARAERAGHDGAIRPGRARRHGGHRHPRGADVGIRGGRIAALGERLGPGSREIDASGHLVMPGGVDAHCHVDQQSSSGLMTADDFFTGGVSAACGGTTTIVPFAAQHRGQRLRDVVAGYRRAAEGRAFIDYGFHLIVSDPPRPCCARTSRIWSPRATRR